MPTGCEAISDGIDLPTAFESDIDDPMLRRLVVDIGNDTRFVSRAARSEPAPQALWDTINASLAGACRGPVASIAAARALALASDRDAGLPSDPKLARISDALLLATSALAARGRLAPPVVDATLEPFGLSVEALTANDAAVRASQPQGSAPSDSVTPEPLKIIGNVSARAGCSSEPKPKTIRQPDYPAEARAVGATGIVAIDLRVGSDGFVRYGRLASSDVPRDRYGNALVRSALGSAFASTFRSDNPSCPLSDDGTYRFVAEFANH